MEFLLHARQMFLFAGVKVEVNLCLKVWSLLFDCRKLCSILLLQ